MKFSCDKALLVNSISTASCAAAAKSAVPALEGLLIKAYGDTVSITGYDLKTGITTTIPADVAEEGEVILNSRLFADIVRKMPDDFITVMSDGNNITKIVCNVSEFKIVGSSTEDYPDLPNVDNTESIEVKENVLKELIAKTCFAVSDNDSRPIHTGALFEIDDDNVLTVVAVDGYRLALRRENIESCSSKEKMFVVPGSALNEIEKIASDSDDVASVIVGTKHIQFKIKDTVLISRRLEGEFLNYKNSIPQQSKFTVNIDRKAMINVVERVSLLISDKLKNPLRCMFGDEIFRVSVNTSLGHAVDECEMKGSVSNLEIGINNKYLLDALKAAGDDEIKINLTSGVSPCIVVPTDGSNRFLYMILPVRLKSNEG